MKKIIAYITSVAVLAGIFTGCGTTAETSSEPIVTGLPDKKPRLEDDYYANKNFELLSDKEMRTGEPIWSQFTELSNRTNDEFTIIIEDCAKKRGQYTQGSPEQQIADLYACAMDEKGCDAAGLESISPLSQCD